MSRLLVHIGYHKTGTNWLQKEVFRRPATGYRHLGDGTKHPVRRFYRDRPFEFDADDVRAAFAPLIEEAERDGLLPVVTHERLSGAPDSGGYDTQVIADRLRDVFPDARILVVVREQRAMIVSAYKMYVRAGGTASLDDYLDPPRSRTARIPRFDYRYFEYDHLLRYYRSLFGEENVLALPYEQFREDARAFVERIAALAERPIPAEVLDRLKYNRRANLSPSATTISVLRHVNRAAPRGELSADPLVQSRAVRELAQAIYSKDTFGHPALRRLTTRHEQHLRDRVATLVGRRYAESNARTSELLGLDLSRYGWTL